MFCKLVLFEFEYTCFIWSRSLIIFFRWLLWSYYVLILFLYVCFFSLFSLVTVSAVSVSSGHNCK